MRKTSPLLVFLALVGASAPVAHAGTVAAITPVSYILPIDGGGGSGGGPGSGGTPLPEQTIYAAGTFANGDTFSGSFATDSTNAIYAPYFGVTAVGATDIYYISLPYIACTPTTCTVTVQDASRASTLTLEALEPTLFSSGPLLAASNLDGSVLTAGLVQGTPVSPIPTVPTSVTPEPSSLLLLGTGILGAVGAVRRRLN